MHGMRALGSPRTLVSLVLGLVALLALAGCGGPGAESPEALFARVQEHTAKADWRAFWGLYTADERRRQTEGWESFKEFLRRNPAENNREHCRRTFHVSPEELYALAPLEIFQLTMRGQEGRMDGARIENVEAAADLADGARIWWLDRHGDRHSMLAQQRDGGWLLVRAVE